MPKWTPTVDATSFLANRLMDAYEVTKKVVNWTIENITDNEKGFFYYQKSNFYA